MSHKRLVTAPGCLWIRHMAIGFAGVVTVVPASFAQDARVLDRGKSAETGIETQEPHPHDEVSDGLRAAASQHPDAIVAVPMGRVRVGPEFVGGEPIYARRVAREGMMTVEVSTTPFMPEPIGVDELIARPDQPAGW
jgi:hypothetical protein